MNVRSLGYQTDLIFPAFDGEILDRRHYKVIRTPANPTFFWGNYLLFAEPPQKGDFSNWRDLFAKEIGMPPETQHQAFGWDSTDGDVGAIQPFLNAGFQLNHSLVMTVHEPLAPLRSSKDVDIRVLDTESDWGQALENQVICREPEFDEVGFRAFRRGQMKRYRKMAATGLGEWYGAFVGKRLVADAGVFLNGRLGRFQSVQTHPDFRRRGIGGTLVFESGRQALTKHNLQTLVIVADETSGPTRLYETIGFEQVEEQVGLEWWPQRDLRSNNGG
jgi:GNAT superfamily N-acetyltransferase